MLDPRDQKGGLSEPHNFGRRVRRLDDGFIFKPRSIFWESLFLGRSFFKQQIADFFLKAGCLDPLASFPTLQFRALSGFSGEVETLRIDSLQDISESESQSLGAACALLSWFGVVDLNHENVWIGRIRGDFCFAPIDIECLGADLSHLGQTNLVPWSELPEDRCGLWQALPILRETKSGQKAALCKGYLDTLALCQERESDLDDIFAESLTDQRIPLRVILRKTKSYVNFMLGCPKPREFEMPPTDSELAQMERGDIPYYFCYTDDPNVFHFAEPDVPIISDVNGHRLMEPKQYFRMRRLMKPSDTRLAAGSLSKAGALQLCRFLFTKEDSASSQFLDTKIFSDGQTIYLEHGSDLKIKCSLKSP